MLVHSAFGAKYRHFLNIGIWGIETSFRELKYTIGLTNLHSKNVEYICQEIYAKLILYNFCEIILANIILEERNRKYTYQLNYTMAIQICRH